jgi:hypothetical protein
VAINGAGDPRRPDVRTHVSVAPQALALYDVLSADENVRFFGTLYGVSGAALDARVRYTAGSRACVCGPCVAPPKGLRAALPVLRAFVVSFASDAA